MSKFSFYLLALLSFYCYGIQIFNPTASNDIKDEKKVKLGEEFIVDFISDSYFYPWTFLNKDEVSDSIQLLRREVVPYFKFARFEMPRLRRKFNFYFKAIKVTNEAKILKFNYKKNNKILNYYAIKVNVY